MKKRVIVSAFALLMLLSLTACEKKGQNEPRQTDPGINFNGQVMSEPVTTSENEIYGRWEAENGPAIEINANSDGKYTYYLDKNNTSDNYYKGPFEISSGPKAIVDLSLSAQEYLEKYDSYAGGLKNAFALKLQYETFQSEGTDKSDTLNKSEYMNFLFLLSEDNADKALLVNMNDSTSTELTRVK
ncbi:hypothetical protein [Acetivibrio clariflavus]|uniref:Lipoprotein n=1 Tax=Acetivibrio clariflavus (strain DSM 19732 / NBRC 101661 / EBR45) TaxID=720554 RepID=G8LVK5_ACECE|nr:hypothetical protein [Acetivibrio clariflavus]AEV69641.1 hypothetical protein Clocl_3114 [Acetivibrio clariflavus DSM 19732]